MLKINPNSIANSYDSHVIIDIETTGLNYDIHEYWQNKIGNDIDTYLLKQFTDMCVQIDSRPKNLSLTDTVEFDRYAFPSYVSINYKDNKTPLIPIVL
jgi:hypothetical protein